MMDNLVFATNSMRSSVSSLKKKLSNLRIQVELFDAEIEKIEAKFDKVITESEIYKAKLGREMSREVRKLELDLARLKKETATNGKDSAAETSVEELNIAKTICILDVVLRTMCEGADDFRLMTESFLFPAVIERVVAGAEDAYFLDEVPASALVVVERGREYIKWLRESHDTHLTDSEVWEQASGAVCEWWKNDALPLLYGSRDEQWDLDVPLRLQEMLLCKDSPGDRPLHFSAASDAYDIYRRNKDSVYESTGARSFELKTFSFKP